MRNSLHILRSFIREAVSLEKNEPIGPPTRDVVLVNDGSFNPVHRGHVNVTLAAKSAAEAMGYNVVGLYMVPKHKSWLERKFAGKGDQLVDDEKRLAFLRQAVGGTGITLDEWEIMGDSYNEEAQYKAHYEGKHPGATYVMITGSDYGACSPMPCFEMYGGSWHIRLARTEGLSSTKIRGAAKDGADMSEFTFPEVEKYMKGKYGTKPPPVKTEWRNRTLTRRR